MTSLPEKSQLIQRRFNPADYIWIFFKNDRKQAFGVAIKRIFGIVGFFVPCEQIFLDVRLIGKRLVKTNTTILFNILDKLAEQNQVLLNNMDVLRLPFCVFKNLFSNIRYNQRGITTNDFPFILFIAFNLSKILLYHINDKIRIFIGQFANRVKKHTSQCIQSIINFQNLRINSSQKLLIYSIKSFDFCHSNLKIRYCSLDYKPLEFHFRCRLNQDFRNRDCFTRVLFNFLNKLIL